MIAVRVKSGENIGIGHLVRMSYLADALRQAGKEVLFLLDARDAELEPYLRSHKAVYLDETPKAIGEAADAERTLELLEDYPVEWVVVDSYELGIGWENRIKSAGYRLMAMDDIRREHNCDMLCDQRWEGETRTWHRYDGRVPERCVKLLGPKYLLVNPQYSAAKPVTPERATVMLSLGGGGDLSIFRELIAALLSGSGEPIRILVVVGPLSYNRESTLALRDRDARVEVVEHASSLYDYYLQTSLFVGALGTSLYELALLKLPALTFSLAENQENDTASLEALGHYLHLSLEEFRQADRIAALIRTLLQHLPRLRELRRSPALELDAKGVQRVAAALCGRLQEPETYALRGKSRGSTQLAPGVSVRPVEDDDINHYLESRNLAQNRQNMVVDTEIPRVEHYRWWFENGRDSYLLEKNGRKILYIWEQKITFEATDFLIGGWFVCEEGRAFDLAAAALQWQLDRSAEKHPGATWIAVIKKTNDYVHLLNRYMGFVPVEADEPAFRAIRHCFNNPSPDEYHYVKKPV